MSFSRMSRNSWIWRSGPDSFARASRVYHSSPSISFWGNYPQASPSDFRFHFVAQSCRQYTSLYSSMASPSKYAASATWSGPPPLASNSSSSSTGGRGWPPRNSAPGPTGVVGRWWLSQRRRAAPSSDFVDRIRWWWGRGRGSRRWLQCTLTIIRRVACPSIFTVVR